ncbi:hypothetical protein [Hymenobacter sp. BT18]|uniref:hypothetical protein n=1 Tax=Hymenobacter sp. BT18 TaxID=2835648 RepID=UPI003977968B
MPKYQLLVYPTAGATTNRPSYQASQETAPLNKAGMEWFFKNYLRPPCRWPRPVHQPGGR